MSGAARFRGSVVAEVQFRKQRPNHFPTGGQIRRLTSNLTGLSVAFVRRSKWTILGLVLCFVVNLLCNVRQLFSNLVGSCPRLVELWRNASFDYWALQPNQIARKEMTTTHATIVIVFVSLVH